MTRGFAVPVRFMRAARNLWHLCVSRSETCVPILVSCRHGILGRRAQRGGPCGLKFGEY